MDVAIKACFDLRLFCIPALLLMINNNLGPVSCPSTPSKPCSSTYSPVTLLFTLFCRAAVFACEKDAIRAITLG